MRRRALAWALGAALVLAGAAGGRLLWARHQADRSLQQRVAAVVPPRPGPPCTDPRPALRLLVLGQSNAGNHGGEESPMSDDQGPRVSVQTAQGCRRLADPLPGGTGQGHSIWTRLDPSLSSQAPGHAPVIALLAVDATGIDDWTRPGSALLARLDTLLGQLAQQGFRPDLVLWQQGEADARQGTSKDAYESGMERLRQHLRHAGVTAPIVLARSTRCRNDGGNAIVQAQAQLVRRHPDLRLGPDTDGLAGAMRVNDCHFSIAGLQAAARLWAETLAPLVGSADVRPPQRPGQ